MSEIQDISELFISVIDGPIMNPGGAPVMDSLLPDLQVPVVANAEGVTPAPSSEPKAPTTKRPRGRAPKGKRWDYTLAEYVERKEGEEDSIATGTEGAPRKKRVKKPSVGGPSRPRGRAPRGKKWDPATANWVWEDPEAAALRDARIPRPKGRAPKNTTWDYVIGKYVEAPEPVVSEVVASTTPEDATLVSEPVTEVAMVQSVFLAPGTFAMTPTVVESSAPSAETQESEGN